MEFSVPSTTQAVKAFQKIFGLTQDGIVGQATWYQLERIYVAVKRLAELQSEGISLSDQNAQFPSVLQMGMRGVRLQCYSTAWIWSPPFMTPSRHCGGWDFR